MAQDVDQQPARCPGCNKRPCLTCTLTPPHCGSCCKTFHQGEECDGHGARSKCSKRGTRAPQMKAARAVMQNFTTTRTMCRKIATNPDARPLTSTQILCYWILVSRSLLDESETIDQFLENDALLGFIHMLEVQECLVEVNQMYRNAKHMQHLRRLAERIWKPDGGRFVVRAQPLREDDEWMQENEGLWKNLDFRWGDVEEPPLPEPDLPRAPGSSADAAPCKVLRKRLHTIEENEVPQAEVLHWSEEDTLFSHANWRKGEALHDVHEKLYTEKHRTQEVMPWRVFEESIPACFCEKLRMQGCPGSFPWNNYNDRCLRHSYRATGKFIPKVLQGQEWLSFHKWRESRNLPMKCGIGSLVTAGDNFVALATWLKDRPSIREHLRLITRVRWPHFRTFGMDKSQWRSMEPALGRWWKLYFDYTVDLMDLPKGEELGWHGTTLYTLHRVCAKRNLECGFAENAQAGKIASGIFYMRGTEAHACLNYMLYNDVQNDGWLWGVLLQLVVRRTAFMNEKSGEQVATLKRRLPQQITLPNYCKLNAVYIHQIHISEVLCSAKDQWWNVESGFDPKLEISPESTWQEVINLSKYYNIQGVEPAA